MQRTLKRAIRLEGIGLHMGQDTSIRICPAGVDKGVRFRRTDVSKGDNEVVARWDNVCSSRLNTTLCNDDGISVSTVEHVMAALAGCAIQNAEIEIDGPEVPVFDGSARPVVRAVLDAGVEVQNASQRMLKILEPVRVEKGDAYAELLPSETLEIEFTIDFADAAIGRQTLRRNFANGVFVREFCDCRTFCRLSDVTAMQSNGLALGGSLDNAVVIDGEKVLNPGGFRRADECVRHKMLDALGDLALTGGPLMAHYRGYKAGHAMTNALLRKLFETPSAYAWTTVSERTSARLPGRDLTNADLVAVAA